MKTGLRFLFILTQFSGSLHENGSTKVLIEGIVMYGNFLVFGVVVPLTHLYQSVKIWMLFKGCRFLSRHRTTLIDQSSLASQT